MGGKRLASVEGRTYIYSAGARASALTSAEGSTYKQSEGSGVGGQRLASVEGRTSVETSADGVSARSAGARASARTSSFGADARRVRARGWAASDWRPSSRTRRTVVDQHRNSVVSSCKLTSLPKNPHLTAPRSLCLFTEQTYVLKHMY